VSDLAGPVVCLLVHHPLRQLEGAVHLRMRSAVELDASSTLGQLDFDVPKLLCRRRCGRRVPPAARRRCVASGAGRRTPGQQGNPQRRLRPPDRAQGVLRKGARAQLAGEDGVHAREQRDDVQRAAPARVRGRCGRCRRCRGCRRGRRCRRRRRRSTSSSRRRRLLLLVALSRAQIPRRARRAASRRAGVARRCLLRYCRRRRRPASRLLVLHSACRRHATPGLCAHLDLACRVSRLAVQPESVLPVLRGEAAFSSMPAAAATLSIAASARRAWQRARTRLAARASVRVRPSWRGDGPPMWGT